MCTEDDFLGEGPDFSRLWPLFVLTLIIITITYVLHLLDWGMLVAVVVSVVVYIYILDREEKEIRKFLERLK